MKEMKKSVQKDIFDSLATLEVGFKEAVYRKCFWINYKFSPTAIYKEPHLQGCKAIKDVFLHQIFSFLSFPSKLLRIYPPPTQ